jgi:hypothetical protein
MPTNGKRVAYGRNQNRVAIATYPDDTSVPVRTSHWNQNPHDQAILGFTKITATLDSSGVIYTKDDSSTYLEDDGSTYSRQSTLIEVECTGVTTTDAIVKIDVTDTNENDILYLFKATASDTITIADATPSVAGHIKTQLSGGATLVHDGVPIMLIRRGDYWYEFGADGAASTPYAAPTIGSTSIASGSINATIAGLTLTTPNIGTPSAGVLTNCTALPAAQVAQGTMASGMVLVAPALGTPASGVLTSCTGLPLAGLTTAAKTEALIIACSDESTVLAGTETAKFVLPYGFEVTKVKGSLNTTGASNVVCTVTRGGSALATVTISGTTADDSSPTNTTGAENDVVSITIGAADATATGLKIYLIGYQT